VTETNPNSLCDVWDHVVSMFNATLNCVQIVMVAWLAKRAVKKDAIDAVNKEHNGH